MDKEDAKELYRSAQNLNAQWRRVISTYTGFAITINVAIWSYLLKAYVDSLDSLQIVGKGFGIKTYIDYIATAGQPLFIGIAAAISSIVFGAWRYHNRMVDNDNFGLLTDLLRYELMSHVPEYSGTQGHLINTRPKLKQIFTDNDLSDEEKLAIISILVKNRRMGWHQQCVLEWCIFALIALMFIFVSLLLSSNLLEMLLCDLGIIAGLIIIGVEIHIFHKEPDKLSVLMAIDEVKNCKK